MYLLLAVLIPVNVIWKSLLKIIVNLLFNEEELMNLVYSLVSVFVCILLSVSVDIHCAICLNVI